MIFLNELKNLDCPPMVILGLEFHQFEKENFPNQVLWKLISDTKRFSISIIYTEKDEAPGNMQYAVLIHDNENKSNQSVYLIKYITNNYHVNCNPLDIRNLNGTAEERFNIFLSKMQELLSNPDLAGFFKGEEIDPEYYMDVWKLVDK